jgi:hypothetical protein
MRSTSASSAAIALNARASSPTSSREAARHRRRRGRHLAQRRGHPARQELHDRERDQRGQTGAHGERIAEPEADRQHDDRARDRGHDHDAELDLDRAEEVERPHRPVSSA